MELKLKLFEYAKTLTYEQIDVANIVKEHINYCDDYSDKEIIKSLNNTLEPYKFYESINTFISEIETEINENSLLYTLKDLYFKVKRKENRFIYESALNSLLECINQPTDTDRKTKVLSNLKMYDWIPEIKMFLIEMYDNPQIKQNYTSKGAIIDDVYSVVLQIKEGFISFVNDTWFLMTKENVRPTLLENHITDEVVLKRMRLLEDAIIKSKFEDNKITFKISEELNISFNTETKEILLNNESKEEETTLESLFNSPIIPFVAKGFYPVLVETYNNLDKFYKLDNVKHVYNLAYPTFECFVFNYETKIAQYRIDRRSGTSFITYENALPIIENVMHELGADLTFFYENVLSDDFKKKNELNNKEKVLKEKLQKIEESILKIKDEKELLANNKTLKKLYTSLLSQKHVISENIKNIKNLRAKLYS